MPQHRTSRPDATPRRGMLLLLVVSILALFVVIGAVGVLMALRARDSALAFASAAVAPAGSAAVARAQLDEALLKLIRGPSSPLPPSGIPTDVTESLLEDKYGASGTTCTVTQITGTANGFFAGITGTVTVSGLSLPNVAGRVLTFVPSGTDATGPSSYRILCTGTIANTLLLANVKPSTPLPLPSVLPCTAVVNGREFDGSGNNEPYDAFDVQADPNPKNAFLTNSGTLVNSRVQQVMRPAFSGTGPPTLTVDNDGDGVLDGVWLSNVLPPQRTTDGSQMKFDVSYLVLDLDGRINVNAHGSFVRAQTPQDATAYPQDPANVPVGMGYGPADVDGALALAGQAAGSGTNRWALLLQGGVTTTNALVSSLSQWRPAPRAGPTQAGRYGLGPASGPGGSTAATVPNPMNAEYWVWNTASSGTAPPNSPTDLKARLQVFTLGSPPALRFARPAGVPWSADFDDVVLGIGTGTAAHPYRIRLDDDGPRASGTNSADAVFTLGELETILRPFDADAATLAPRLAAILDDYAERSRLTTTTDSWDTPAVTGTTSGTIQVAAAGCPDPSAVLSPETVAGLRMNLNRPIFTGTAPAVTGTAARAEYFKHLYSLAMAVSGATGEPTAVNAAQWAANVIEFRDPDSIMTWYPYDPNPFDANGFTTGPASPGVWGVERPEIVITSATYNASANTVTVSLYRPWDARLMSGTNVSGTSELIDASLGSRATNTLNLSGTVVGGTNAIWRLEIANSSTTNLGTLLPAGSGTAVQCNSGTFVTGSAASMPPSVTLLRLADPTRSGTNATDLTRNDYVPVHTGTVTALAAPRDVKWWLHWPNRDFVSHGELLVVPSGTAAAVAEALFDERNEAFLALTGTLAVTGGSAAWGPRLLEATIVPSMFLGANASVSGTSNTLNAIGMQNFRYGQLSKWREAGRVNVNTILPNVGNTPASLDNAVWAALAGRGGLANPVTSGTNYKPFQSITELLVSGTCDRTGDPRVANAFLRRSTAIRLANCATTRSHVFAVWITLRITDSAGNNPRYARLFAIVDRSIPVGYAPGRTLNVRETVRLQRFLP